jgi:putative transposase
MKLFRSRKDHEAFQQCLIDAMEKVPMRVLGYCVMPNHWHLVLWPKEDGDLAKFMMRLTIAHVRRWLIHRGEVGTGHVYQGRYKSFIVQDDAHLSTLCRYVDRNAVRAGLVNSCVDWLWSSAGQAGLPASRRIQLTELPIPRRKEWIKWVNQPQTIAEEQSLSRCIMENRPFGTLDWTEKIKKAYGWREPQKRGRPWPKGKHRTR